MELVVSKMKKKAFGAAAVFLLEKNGEKYM
jgi:hypothetical protein